MSKELLNEFVITKCGTSLIVSATDKAYELLGLKEKTITYPNGAIIDTIDPWYYRVALLTFLKNNYIIDVLVRESRGNSHDSSSEKEVTIFNGGNEWQEEIDVYKHQENSTFEDKPEIIEEQSITSERIEEWSKEYNLSYNGEGIRLVYCSYNDKTDKIIYLFDHTYCLGSANEKMYSNKSKKLPMSLVLKVLK